MTESAILLIIASTIAVAYGRFLIPGHSLSPAGIYEALVHIWVGVVGTLAVLWWGTAAGYLCAAGLLLTTLLETVIFLHAVKTGRMPVWTEGEVKEGLPEESNGQSRKYDDP